MATAIGIYSICASAIIIWCSLRSRLDYRAISSAALNKWKIERENLIVFNLLMNAKEPGHASTYGALEICHCELPDLLRWIPRNSTVVFCHRVRIQPFNSRVEDALLQAAIDTVYFMDVRQGDVEPAAKLQHRS